MNWSLLVLSLLQSDLILQLCKQRFHFFSLPLCLGEEAHQALDILCSRRQEELLPHELQSAQAQAAQPTLTVNPAGDYLVPFFETEESALGTAPSGEKSTAPTLLFQPTGVGTSLRRLFASPNRGESQC